MEPLNLNLIVDLLREDFGVPAFVTLTGGGGAAIYAGEPWDEENWGSRYPIIAGPGWFDGGSMRNTARAARGDFYIGPDDDSEGGLEALVTPDPHTSHHSIALIIASLVPLHTARH